MLTEAEEAALEFLLPHGGVVDRYGRVVASGEARPQLATGTFLRLVARGLIEGIEGHLYVSSAGRRALEESDRHG